MLNDVLGRKTFTRSRRIFGRYSGLALIILMLPFNAFVTCAAAEQTEWLVGVGKADITGPAAGVSMLGYGDSAQISTGIHDRMWARAFIVAEPASGRRVVIVVASVAMVYGDVTREVIARLKHKYGELYQEGGLLLVADHTHNGNGGFGGHFLFSISTKGFYPEAYEALVGGVVEAVEKAHNTLAPGRVLSNKGELSTASANRSLNAFLRNPESRYLDSIDKEMLVLRFEHQQELQLEQEQSDTDQANAKPGAEMDSSEGYVSEGAASEKRPAYSYSPIGMLGWFPTHGVSLPMENTLISSDNKGYAAWLMEREQGKGFVAAFPQTNAGDMTPNLFLNGTGPGKTPEQSARMIGERQYRCGKELFDSAIIPVTGSLDWRHEYVNLAGMQVRTEFTGLSYEKAMCRATVGYSFAGGTVDGRPPPWRYIFYDGDNKAFWPVTWGSSYLTGLTEEVIQCQAPKASLLGLGENHQFETVPRLLNYIFSGRLPEPLANLSWVPQVVPVSLVQLGDIGLLGVPAECSYVSGQRLKRTVKEVLGERFRHHILAGYANDYVFYVTTPEEYQAQLYEAGATLFGPWTLAAYQQVFERLAANLQEPGTFALTKPWPEQEPEPDNLMRYYEAVPALDIDTPGQLEDHGVLESMVPTQIWPGQTVTACFSASHPVLGIRNLDSFLTVEKRIINANYTHSWEVIENDDSWNTRFRWQAHRSGKTSGQACVQWLIPDNTPEGVYRLGHQGLWRNNMGKLVSYEGFTSPIKLRAKPTGADILLQSRVQFGRHVFR